MVDGQVALIVNGVAEIAELAFAGKTEVIKLLGFYLGKIVDRARFIHDLMNHFDRDILLHQHLSVVWFGRKLPTISLNSGTGDAIAANGFHACA